MSMPIGCGRTADLIAETPRNRFSKLAELLAELVDDPDVVTLIIRGISRKQYCGVTATSLTILRGVRVM